LSLEEEAPRAAAGLPAKPLWWRAGKALQRSGAGAWARLRRLAGAKPAPSRDSRQRSLRRCGSELFDRQSGAWHPSFTKLWHCMLPIRPSLYA